MPPKWKIRTPPKSTDPIIVDVVIPGGNDFVQKDQISGDYWIVGTVVVHNITNDHIPLSSVSITFTGTIAYSHENISQTIHETSLQLLSQSEGNAIIPPKSPQRFEFVLVLPNDVATTLPPSVFRTLDHIVGPNGSKKSISAEVHCNYKLLATAKTASPTVNPSHASQTIIGSALVPWETEDLNSIPLLHSNKDWVGEGHGINVSVNLQEAITLSGGLQIRYFFTNTTGGPTKIKSVEFKIIERISFFNSSSFYIKELPLALLGDNVLQSSGWLQPDSIIVRCPPWSEIPNVYTENSVSTVNGINPTILPPSAPTAVLSPNLVFSIDHNVSIKVTLTIPKSLGRTSTETLQGFLPLFVIGMKESSVWKLSGGMPSSQAPRVVQPAASQVEDDDLARALEESQLQAALDASVQEEKRREEEKKVEDEAVEQEMDRNGTSSGSVQTPVLTH